MIEVPESNPDWVTYQQAEVMIGVRDAGRWLRESRHIRQAVVLCDRPGRNLRAFHDDDVLAIAAVYREGKVTLAASVRIFDAVKDGRLSLDARATQYRETLETIVDRALLNGEDVCYLIAKQGLE